MSESKQTYYEKLVYEALMTRELVTYDRVMAKSETPNTISTPIRDKIAISCM